MRRNYLGKQLPMSGTGLLTALLLVVAVLWPLSLLANNNMPIGNLGLKSLTGGLASAGEPLDVEDAFVFGKPTYKNEKLQLTWTIPPDYYLYQSKFKVELQAGQGLEAGELILPEGKEKKDDFFGTIYALYNFAEVGVPIKRSEQNATTLMAKVTWQGCMESMGICYPPQSKVVRASLPAVTQGASSELLVLDEVSDEDFEKAGSTVKNADGKTTQSSATMLSEQDKIAGMLSGDNTFFILMSFLGFGLLLSFTPCVFPMVPILSGIIAGQKGITTRKAFILSLVYVLAMALTYTIAGVLAGLFGSNLQAALQNPWALGTFSAIFVLLALSMFGFYELQIPASLQTRLNEFSNRQAGGSYLGVAIMGVLSALIVGPCVAAPLAGALIYIGMTGDAVLGGMALFALSIGMGIPLLIVGTLAGEMLPRAGQWMESVKAIFGVMLLGVAIWMLERVLPMWLVMLLWAALLIISAIFMGALSSLSEQVSGWAKLWKGLGIMLLIHGALLMVGAAVGGNDVIQPLKGVMGSAGGGASVQKLPFRIVKGVDELQQAIDQSKNKVVMLDFYADWCVYCKDMEKNTFPDPAVRGALSDVVLLKADVTANDPDDKALQKHFNVIAPPAILFFDREGVELEHLRLVGFMGPGEFAAHVAQAK